MKKQLVFEDLAKSDASIRSYPLDPIFKKYLLNLKAEQDYYKKICGYCYEKDYCITYA